MNWATPREQALLASVLDDPRHLADAGKVRRAHFTTDRAGEVWAALVELDNRQRPVTAIAIARKLGGDKALARDLQGCVDLISAGKVRPAQAEWYAEQVIDDAVGREAMRALEVATRAVREPTTNKREAVAVAREALRAVEQPATARENGADLLYRLWQRVEEWRLTPEDQRVWPSVRTGFRGLDRATGGLRLGQLFILGADSSSGKSSFANAVIDNAARDGNPVDVYGYEDDPEAVIARLAARVTRLSNHHLQFGDLNGADPAEFRDQLQGYKETAKRIAIVHHRPSSVTDLCLQIREGCARRGTKLVVIDYIQLLKLLGQGRSNYDRLSHLTSELFHTARRAGCALLVLSQLARPQDKAAERRPTMRDLKDCGDLENFAYGVILLWSRRLQQEVSDGHRTVKRALPVSELLIDKNKNGPVGDQARSLLHFDAHSTTFWDLDDDELRDDYIVAARKANRG